MEILDEDPFPLRGSFDDVTRINRES